MQYNKIIHNEKQLMFTSMTYLFKIPFLRPFVLFSSFNLINLFLVAEKFDILNRKHLIGKGSKYLRYFKPLIKSRQVFRRSYQGTV